MKEAYNPKEHAEATDKALRPRPRKVVEMEKGAKGAEKPEGSEKSKKEKKLKEKKEKPKRDPRVRPLIKSHKSVLVVIPSDIRDAMHLIEAKEQGINVRVDRGAEPGTITITLLGEPKIDALKDNPLRLAAEARN